MVPDLVDENEGNHSPPAEQHEQSKRVDTEIAQTARAFLEYVCVGEMATGRVSIAWVR